MKKDYDVDIEWRPFELHPEIPTEGASRPEYSTGDYINVKQMLKQRANASGREMIFREIIPSSRRALEASEYAREQGKHQVFHDLVFHKHYSEGLDIHEWEVLTDAAEEAGLDAEEMQSQTDAGTYTEVVTEQIMSTYKLGVRGVPAFIFNDKYVVVGAQPYEAFQKAIEQILSDEAEGAPE